MWQTAFLGALHASWHMHHIVWPSCPDCHWYGAGPDAECGLLRAQKATPANPDNYSVLVVNK